LLNLITSSLFCWFIYILLFISQLY